LKSASWRLRMKIFPYTDVEPQDANSGAEKVKVRWLITKKMGAPNFAMRLFEVGRGGCSPFHDHIWEHEVFILEGEGSIMTKEGPRKFKQGDVVFVLPNEKHQFRNEGKDVLRFLCLVPIEKKTK
jgi:quercetin dioxygenase-like cupin family protein